MAAYFFTGGIMPSDDLLLYFQKHVHCKSHWLMSGIHYQRTAQAWLERTDANRLQILAAFSKTYGDEALTYLVRWRIFFMAVEELWGWANGNEWTVSHYLFEKSE